MIDQEHLGLFSALLNAGVEFAVVGGVAVNVHGYVRATHDLDIFIRPSISNVEAAFLALTAFGAPTQGMEATDLLSDERHFRFGTKEDHVDVLASIGDMTFDEVWLERIEVHVEGLSIPFISKDRLLENKRQTGRHRDLLDVEELELLPHQEGDKFFR